MESQDSSDSALVEDYGLAAALMGVGDQGISHSRGRTPTIDGLSTEYEDHGAGFTPLRDSSDWRLVDFLADAEDTCLCPSRYCLKSQKRTHAFVTYCVLLKFWPAFDTGVPFSAFFSSSKSTCRSLDLIPTGSISNVEPDQDGDSESLDGGESRGKDAIDDNRPPEEDCLHIQVSESILLQAVRCDELNVLVFGRHLTQEEAKWLVVCYAQDATALL
jgi:hypothetical protein